MKTFLNTMLAILFVGMGIGFVFFFEFYFKEKVDTVEVVVATSTIDFKKEITADNISIVNVKRGQEVENSIPVTAYQSLIGKYASVKIEKGTQIYMDLIDTYNLVPDSTKGEFVAPLPKEWLYAVPGSLRRTFVADVYAINDKDTLMKNALLSQAKEQGDVPDGTPIQTSVVPNTEPILKNVRVASVKDNGNKEVRESEESSDATGQVAALEIIANDEMLEVITNAMNDGYKLYVVYKFERSSDIAAGEETIEETVAEEVAPAESESTIVEDEEVDESGDEETTDDPEENEESIEAKEEEENDSAA